MLKHLLIKNYTLIDKLDISFQPGFSVITGETGAGKSIILGAISLLLGQRAEGKVIKTGADRCIIEAHFDLSTYAMGSFFQENDIDDDTDDCIIRRELTAAGKSRSFINDTPVPLSLMKQLGQQLVDIHSQHKNLMLQEEDFQLNTVDIIANHQKKLQQYQEAYKQYQSAQEKLAKAKADIEKASADADYLRFQQNELDEASLYPGMQDELEQESEMLSHVEDIKSNLYLADHLFNGDNGIGILSQLKEACRSLESITNVFPDVQEAAKRLDSSYIEINDIAREVGNHVERLDYDPNRLNYLNEKLDVIYNLEKKHRVHSVEELIALRDDIAARLSSIDNSDALLEELELEVKARKKECTAMALVLTEERRQAADKIEKEMTSRLIPLGIPHVRFEIRINEKPLSPNGADSVCFMFSANTSTPLRPVSEVASGGEIARVMLSLKAMISGAVKLPTIIFDEIDTGVSGKIAEQMAQMMHDMGQHHRQVISITHLPQIAAKGSTHFKVYKEETPQGTISHMKELNSEQRLMEIAQMLSGSDVSQAAIDNAKTLLGLENNHQ